MREASHLLQRDRQAAQREVASRQLEMAVGDVDPVTDRSRLRKLDEVRAEADADLEDTAAGYCSNRKWARCQGCCS